MTTPLSEGLNTESINPDLVFAIAETTFARLGLRPGHSGDIDLVDQSFCFYYQHSNVFGASTIYSDWFSADGNYCQVDADRGGKLRQYNLNVLADQGSWRYDSTNNDAPDFVQKVITELVRRCASI
jgi:hypothetical protein